MIALYTGVTGLSAHEQAVDVIANNIANINTTAYKAGRASFEDALSETISGGTEGTNPMQIGLGVTLGAIDPNMTQGSLQATGRATDMAVVGSGFFVLGEGDNVCYTRAGNFGLDGSNRLVSLANGMSVLGWQADPVTGAVNTSTTINGSSTINVPIGTRALARASSNVVYQANLDSNTAVGNTVDTSFYVYDSLGNSHRVDLAFTKTADNTWGWVATGADADPAVAPAAGTLVFDEHGQNTTPTAPCSLALLAPGGATSPIDFAVDFGSVTQLAGDSSIRAVSQDGLSIGWLESFTIDDTGLITGSFSNGMTQALGQIAMASFTNPTGLLRTGGNNYLPSPNSGVPHITTAGHGGCGTVSSGYLEMSNVNLAEEFANLIVTQRGFQANSRIISTADEMLQEVVTLKR